MNFKLKPYPHQLHAIDLADQLGNVGLLWEMGCLCGDTEIKINRGGCSRTYKLGDAYQRFHSSWNKTIPSKIRSYKSDQKVIGLHDIIDIVYSGVKPCYELELEDGKHIVATKDHRFLTDEGWKRLHKLTVTDRIMVDDTKKHQKKEVKPPRKNKNRYILNQVGRFHPYAQYFIDNKCGGVKKYRGLKHRLIVEADINNMELAEFKAATYFPNDLVFLDTKKYHVHHKDHDHTNNMLRNLEILTVEEHLKRHADVKTIGHGLPSFSPIAKISFVGDRDTYDICCDEPHHNFVAQGMVVHNSGKTGGMVNILRQLYTKEGRLMRTLILSPLVTLFNWKEEFAIHSNVDQNRIQVLSKGGSKGKQKTFIRYAMDFESKQLTNDAVFITNYETMNADVMAKLVDEWRPEIIILDEAHYIKNPKAKRSKAIIKLADKVNHKFILTGTPILNSVMDVFMLFRFLDNGATFGKSMHVFKSKYMEDENAAWSNRPGYFPKLTARAETFEELTNLIYTRCHRVLKKDVIKDLPPLVKMVRLVDMGSEQRKAYKEMERDFITFVESKEKAGEPAAVVATLAITKALRLQQIASGYVTTEDGEEIVLKDNPRLDLTEELLKEIVIENGHSCILWCSFIQNYKMLGALCTKLGLKYGQITGAMKLEEKHADMVAFNKGETKVIIANRRAGGIGINLVAASYSIVYSRNFSLGEELQSEARNHRGGSQIHEQVVKIDLAARDTVDEAVLEALINKNDVSKKVIDLIRG